MALIDVDRHILMQLINIQTKIKLLSARYDLEWQKIIEVRDKTDALFMPPVKGNDEDFKKLRNKIFKATRQCQKYANEIAGMIYKQEALMMHLITEIKEADTGKGKEGLDGNIMDKGVVSVG